MVTSCSVAAGFSVARSHRVYTVRMCDALLRRVAAASPSQSLGAGAV